MGWHAGAAEEAEGRAARTCVTIYPPGVPMLMPGERIGIKEIARIREIGSWDLRWKEFVKIRQMDLWMRLLFRKYQVDSSPGSHIYCAKPYENLGYKAKILC